MLPDPSGDSSSGHAQPQIILSAKDIGIDQERESHKSGESTGPGEQLYCFLPFSSAIPRDVTFVTNGIEFKN